MGCKPSSQKGPPRMNPNYRWPNSWELVNQHGPVIDPPHLSCGIEVLQRGGWSLNLTTVLAKAALSPTTNPIYIYIYIYVSHIYICVCVCVCVCVCLLRRPSGQKARPGILSYTYAWPAIVWLDPKVVLLLPFSFCYST